MSHDTPASWYVFELISDVFANVFERFAAIWAIIACRQMFDGIAWQMFRQWFATTARAFLGSRARRWRILAVIEQQLFEFEFELPDLGFQPL